jgi:hypothetical protein
VLTVVALGRSLSGRECVATSCGDLVISSKRRPAQCRGVRNHVRVLRSLNRGASKHARVSAATPAIVRPITT